MGKYIQVAKQVLRYLCVKKGMSTGKYTQANSFSSTRAFDNLGILSTFSERQADKECFG